MRWQLFRQNKIILSKNERLRRKIFPIWASTLFCNDKDFNLKVDAKTILFSVSLKEKGCSLNKVVSVEEM